MNKLLIILLVFVFATAGFSQTSEFTKIVESYQKENNFNGEIIVATDGKIDFISGFGLADRQLNSKITARSKFKIASVTKTFTAVLILKLVEQGKIDLNTTIGTYFPSYKGIGRDKVTIHQLLTYSSGIANVGEKIGMLWIHTVKNKKTVILMSKTDAINLFGLSENLYLASLKK